MATTTYEYERLSKGGYIVYKVEPSLVGAGPTRTSLGYAQNPAEVTRLYPSAALRLEPKKCISCDSPATTRASKGGGRGNDVCEWCWKLDWRDNG
jgi:hypothetical protein